MYTDKKCRLDITSKEKGQSFYKANGADVPNGELLAGIGYVWVFLLLVFCWFQRISLTKGTVSPSVLNTGADTGPLQDQYWVQVWLIQAGNGLWDIQVIVNLENEETILPEFEAVV